MKILNGIKLILDDQGNHLDSSAISLESFRSFRGPLFRKPVTSQELFFAFSYSKPALIAYCANIYTVLIDMIRAEWADDKSPWRCVNLE